MFDFIKKWFGIHVCEEFTQWQTHKENVAQQITSPSQIILTGKSEIVTTRRWQEKQCTICGKIIIRELKHG